MLRARDRRPRTKRQLVGVSSTLCIVEVPRTSTGASGRAERVRSYFSTALSTATRSCSTSQCEIWT